jgi:general secretion pathway protein G
MYFMDKGKYEIISLGSDGSEGGEGDAADISSQEL